MNDWKSDEALYASAFDPNKQAAKEIEQLKEEVAKLTREILALKKELAVPKKETATSRKEKTADKKECDKEHANLIKLVANTGEDIKGTFEYLARVYLAIYQHHNKGYKIPSSVLDELEQYKDSFLWESIRLGQYSNDIAKQCNESLISVLPKDMEKVLLDRWMRITKFLTFAKTGQRYYYADVTSEDSYCETTWLDVDDDEHLLSKGLCFHTKEAAIAFAERMA